MRGFRGKKEWIYNLEDTGNYPYLRAGMPNEGILIPPGINITQVSEEDFRNLYKNVYTSQELEELLLYRDKYGEKYLEEIKDKFYISDKQKRTVFFNFLPYLWNMLIDEYPSILNQDTHDDVHTTFLSFLFAYQNLNCFAEWDSFIHQSRWGCIASRFHRISQSCPVLKSRHRKEGNLIEKHAKKRKFRDKFDQKKDLNPFFQINPVSRKFGISDFEKAFIDELVLDAHHNTIQVYYKIKPTANPLEANNEPPRILEKPTVQKYLEYKFTEIEANKSKNNIAYVEMSLKSLISMGMQGAPLFNSFGEKIGVDKPDLRAAVAGLKLLGTHYGMFDMVQSGSSGYFKQIDSGDRARDSMQAFRSNIQYIHQDD